MLGRAQEATWGGESVSFNSALDRWITGGGDGGWRDAYTGTRWVGEWETRDEETFIDVEVELEDGEVVSAQCCAEKAPDRLLEDLRRRYEDE